jgi:hypothetical protein
VEKLRKRGLLIASTQVLFRQGFSIEDWGPQSVPVSSVEPRSRLRDHIGAAPCIQRKQDAGSGDVEVPSEKTVPLSLQQVRTSRDGGGLFEQFNWSKALGDRRRLHSRNQPRAGARND